ncbi:prion-inhibition and propagation-domain-containing protein [Aspergillus filifer]
MPIPPTTIASLTTGSISFVITLFKTSLDLYSVFTTTSLLGTAPYTRDLFKRWGERLGLAENNLEELDERLGQDSEGSLLRAVIVALSSIKQVLGDVEKLKKSYGLEGSDERTEGQQLPVELQGLSLLDSPAVTESQGLMLKESEKMQKRVSIMQKLKWAIEDKDKFGGLVERLTTLNNGLYSLIDPLEADIMAKAVVGQLLRTLDLIRLWTLYTAAKTASNAADIANLAALRERAVRITKSPDTVLIMDLPSYSNGLTVFEDGRCARRSVGTYQAPEVKFEVLVEWKIFNSHMTNKEKIAVDMTTNNLAFFLSNPWTDGLRSLTCIGVTKPTTKEGPGLESVCPTSVFDLLGNREDELDLGQKFIIAQALVQPLYELHVANWLHKAVRSDNILIITRHGRSRQLSASLVYLAGYEFSRHGQPQDPTQPAGDIVRSL